MPVALALFAVPVLLDPAEVPLFVPVAEAPDVPVAVEEPVTRALVGLGSPV